MAKSVAPSTPNSTRPRLSHTSIALLETQNLETHRSASHFPWKANHLRKFRQDQAVGADWAMTSFDSRTDDQFFDSKRLQTIDENSEVRFFFPYDPLDYSCDIIDFDVWEEVRSSDQEKREGYARKVYIGTKSALAQAELKFRNFCCRLIACTHAE